jgi:hypothetical protein
MALQKGIVKIEGTVGGLTFYKAGGEHLVREKGGVSGDRILNDPNFARTRENNAEFGASGAAGKLLRDALRPLLMTASDNLVTSRVTTLMHNIMKQDTTSARGKRLPSVGVAAATGRGLLKGFNFNINAVIGAVMYKPYAVAPATGIITIAGLVPATDIAFPTGATHVSISGAMANINFATGATEVRLTNVTNLAIGAASSTVTLTPTAVPVAAGTKLFLLKVEFFQMVNAVQYAMKNGSYNALAIIETA